MFKLLLITTHNTSFKCLYFPEHFSILHLRPTFFTLKCNDSGAGHMKNAYFAYMHTR